MPLGRADVEAFERTIAGGGIAVFPTDTLYGIGCTPGDEAARERLYRLKGRPPRKPSAVMFFSLERALAATPVPGARTLALLQRLLPGPLLVLLPGAGGSTLGLRVPLLEGPLAPLAQASVAVLQTSANLARGPEPARLADVPEPLRDGADIALDGGELPGTASTVVDLTRYERAGAWEIVREGAVGRSALEAAIAASSAGR